MIYLANRDWSASYLRLRPMPKPHVMIAVIGGLGFLHQITRFTKRLILVDRNPDQVEYGKFVIRTILLSPDLTTFLSIMTCSNVTHQDGAYVKQDRCDHSYLFDPDWQSSYARFLAENPHVEKCFLTCGDQFGTGFTWRGAEPGPFLNEESFSGLKEQLAVTPTEYITGDFQDFDYGQFQEEGLLTYLFISNCDEGLYTTGDAILHRVQSTVKPEKEFYYIANGRIIPVIPDLNHVDAVYKIAPYTYKASVAETISFAGFHFSQNQLRCKEHFCHKFDEFVPRVTGSNCFLYHISLQKTAEKKEKVQRVFRSIVGYYRRAVILDHEFFTGHNEWIEWLREIDFHKSFRLILLDWSGGKDGLSRNIVQVWDRRGSYFPYVLPGVEMS